jgi:hypothetical protein
MSEKVLDVMLDLEFFGTEEDMISEYPAEDAFPIVSSIGLVVQLDGEVKYSNNFAINFNEQLEAGAKFGKRCMLDFWTKQSLLGAEMARTMSQTEEIHTTLTTIAMQIRAMRETFQPTEVNVLGNSLIADNSKVIRLFAKYAHCDLPWSYFENTDYREMLKVATYLGFNKKVAESDFAAQVMGGKYAHLGHAVEALHNAEYDCLKQLNTLNAVRKFLTHTKKTMRITI